MELTQEALERFVGGQLEVQNPVERYVYRGEIASVQLSGEGDDRSLKVHFNWLARLTKAHLWEVDDPIPCNYGLSIYTVSDIGDGRLSFRCWMTGELCVLFPVGGSRLDPRRVKGLVLGD